LGSTNTENATILAIKSRILRHYSSFFEWSSSEKSKTCNNNNPDVWLCPLPTKRLILLLLFLKVFNILSIFTLSFGLTTTNDFGKLFYYAFHKCETMIELTKFCLQ
jgi:hypothetical protein